MIEYLKQLKEYKQDIEKLIVELTPVDEERIEARKQELLDLYDKLTNQDLKSILIAIKLSSESIDLATIVELEIFYGEIIYRWAIAFIEEPLEEVIYEHQDLIEDIQELLSSDIDSINEFCENYLGKDKDKHFSFEEYNNLAKLNYIIRKYKESNKRGFKIEEFGVLEDNVMELIAHEVFEDDVVDFNLIDDDFIYDNVYILKKNEFSLFFVTEPSKRAGNIDDEILKELYRYIIDNEMIKFVRFDNFRYVVHHQNPKPGAERIKWTGQYLTDAWRLTNYLSMKVSVFNKCFVLPEGKKLDSNNKPKEKTKFDRFIDKLKEKEFYFNLS